MYLNTLFVLVSTALLTTALPTTKRSVNIPGVTRSELIHDLIIAKREIPFDPSAPIGDLTTAQVLAAAPQSSGCTSSGGECTSAEEATPLINNAFESYGMKTLGQKAALLATMTFESSDFLYNTEQSTGPGKAGQGTKAMLPFQNLYKYAVAIPALQDQVNGLMGSVTAEQITDSTPTDDVKNAVRALVLPNDYTFGAAPWFLSNVCGTTATTLSSDAANGFANYAGADCLDAGDVGGRVTNWCAAVTALMPEGMTAPAGCA